MSVCLSVHYFQNRLYLRNTATTFATTTIEKQDLAEAEFPAIISILVRTGVNHTALGEAGYELSSELQYYLGVKNKNESHVSIGWASNDHGGGYVSPAGIGYSS